MQYKPEAVNISVGDVVMIKGESKKRGKWKIGIISELFQGKDDQIRCVRVKIRRYYLDRPIRLLYPLELHWYRYKITKRKQHESDEKKLNVEAKEFRPKRTTEAIALAEIKDIAMDDDSGNYEHRTFDCEHSNGGRWGGGDNVGM